MVAIDDCVCGTSWRRDDHLPDDCSLVGPWGSCLLSYRAWVSVASFVIGHRQSLEKGPSLRYRQTCLHLDSIPVFKAVRPACRAHILNSARRDI